MSSKITGIGKPTTFRDITAAGEDDGVSLTMSTHPKPSFWAALTFGFSYHILRRNRLNDAALETVEIDVRDIHDMQKPGIRRWNPGESHNDKAK